MSWEEVLARHARARVRSGSLGGRAVSATPVRPAPAQSSTQRRQAGGGLRPADRVVGTSTNGHSGGEVDYLCDGSGDDVEIEAARADVVNAGSGRILLLGGSYVGSALIDVNAADLTLEGQGWGTILDGMEVLVSGARCEVANLAFATENVAFDFCVDGKAIALRFADPGAYGIFADSTTGLLIAHCHAVGATAAGFSLQSGENGRLVACYAVDCQQGFEIAGDEIVAGGCMSIGAVTEGLTLSGQRCTISGFASIGSGGDAIAITGTDNDILACSARGNVRVDGNGNSLAGTVVRGALTLNGDGNWFDSGLVTGTVTDNGIGNTDLA